jgi:two-component system, NarL family, nitrate/nitrite response regulator NarL
MRKTVLIADDNAFVRTALYEIFEREPDLHVCAVVENGREAIEEACRLNPDLIVLDIAMPVMNGLEAARVLRELMPNVPLILYSANPREVSEQFATSIGIYGMISKSERVSVLIDTVRGALYRRAA